MKQEILIGLSGLARSGKDTAAGFLVDIGYAPYSFAKPIKDFFEALHGWDYEYREGKYKEKMLNVAVSENRMFDVLCEQFGDYLLGTETRKGALSGGMTIMDIADIYLNTLLEHGHMASGRNISGIHNVKMSPRQAYQLFGTNVMRNYVRNSVWIDLAEDFVRRHNGKVVIPDVRFNNEAEFIHDNYGVLIRIERDGIKAVNQHISESALSMSEVDWIIQNNGTLEEFRNNLTILLHQISRPESKKA